MADVIKQIETSPDPIKLLTEGLVYGFSLNKKGNVSKLDILLCQGVEFAVATVMSAQAAEAHNVAGIQPVQNPSTVVTVISDNSFVRYIEGISMKDLVMKLQSSNNWAVSAAA